MYRERYNVQHVHTVTLIKTDWELENNFGDDSNVERAPNNVRIIYVEPSEKWRWKYDEQHSSDLCSPWVNVISRFTRLLVALSFARSIFGQTLCVVDRHTRLVMMAAPLQSVLNGVLFCCFCFIYFMVNEYLVRLVGHATSTQHQRTQI